MSIEQRVCLMCNNSYERQGRKGRGTIYCSQACRMRHRNLTNNPAQSREARAKISAARQGKPTTLGWIPSKTTRKKISRALKGKPGPSKGKPMSEAARAKLSKARRGKMLGKDNPNWRGGTSPRDWKATRYKEFLRQVWAREGGQCQDCGRDQTEGALQVHHVLSWIEAPLFRYDPQNGMLLCGPCHHKRDAQPMTLKNRKRLSRRASRHPRDTHGRFITARPSAVLQ